MPLLISFNLISLESICVCVRVSSTISLSTTTIANISRVSICRVLIVLLSGKYDVPSNESLETFGCGLGSST